MTHGVASACRLSANRDTAGRVIDGEPAPADNPTTIKMAGRRWNAPGPDTEGVLPCQSNPLKRRGLRQRVTTARLGRAMDGAPADRPQWGRLATLLSGHAGTPRTAAGDTTDAGQTGRVDSEPTGQPAAGSEPNRRGGHEPVRGNQDDTEASLDAGQPLFPPRSMSPTRHCHRGEGTLVGSGTPWPH